MTTRVVVRFCYASTSRRRLLFCGSALVAFFALLWGASPAHAATIYHVDDSVNDGLIAYYKLEETFAGDDIAWDLVGGANGAMQGTATFTTSQLSPFIQGQNFGKLQMSGLITDQVLITNTITFGSDFTVAAWIKRGQTNDFQTVFDAGTGAINGHWYVAIGDSTKSNAILFGRRGAFPEVVSNGVIGNTHWHHIAVSHTGANNTLSFYLDGVLKMSVSDIALTPFSGAQRIGAVSIDNTTGILGNFDGNIDELRLYNRALSAGEVQRLASGFGCVFDGLTWAKAFPDLQCALEVSVINDSIRVAKGRYIPGIHPDAHYAFQSGDNVQGGFNGNEADNAARPAINLDPADSEEFLDASKYTVLTGDLRGDDPLDALTDPGTIEDEEEDNLHQIFAVASAAIGTSLDGVVVTGGRSDVFAGAGGGIDGAPSILNSIFLLNRAAYGGGLDIGITATPQLTNLRFIHNAALFFGGGIESEGSLLLNDSRFISNTAGDSGGGLDVRENSATLNNVDFAQNQSPLGGALYVSPNVHGFFYSGGDLALNQADLGGAIYSEAKVTLSDLTVRANNAISQGGGIFAIAPLVIDSSTILSNTQSALSSSSSAGGGGIDTNQSIRLTNSTLQGNHADTGGGLRVDNTFKAESVTLDKVTFLGNQALDGDGGGIYLRSTDHPLTATLTDVTLEDNASIFGSGGGLNLQSNIVLQLTDGLFEGNQADDGGGLFMISASSDPHLTNVTFRNNHALTGNGGAISFCCTSAVMRVQNVVAEVNSSGGNGGGLYVCCGGSITGEQLTLDHNHSTRNGGGLDLCCTSTPSSLQAVTVTANSAISDGGGIALGGGSDMTITNGLIKENLAGSEGGGVEADAGVNFTLINVRVEGNVAQGTGGGIFLTLGSVKLTDVQIVRNNSVHTGGGGLSLNTTFGNVLRDVDFIENTDNDDNGAALRMGRGDLIMDRVSFLGNISDQNAGAIALENRATVTATNALFVGNIGNTDGGISNDANAIFIENKSALHLINSTLAGNSGTGIGLVRLQDTSSLSLTNVILWDNAPPTISNEGTGAVVQRNVISGNPAGGTDPRFVRNPDPGDGDWATFDDNDYGDLHLRASSPAIDQGDGDLLPAGISQDFDGNTRIFDAAFVPNAFATPVDLGAFEARFVAPTANAGGPYHGNEGQPMALDGSASSDEGTLVSFAWDCSNDNTDDASSSNPTGQSCTYADQGAFTLRLRVTDNDGISKTSTVTVTVDNVAPLAKNDSVAIAEDTPITINVLANDSDVAADPLAITSVTIPTHGSAAIQAGNVRYSPAADFNGADSFTYSISDGDGGSATATVSVTVTPVDDPDEPEGATILLPMLSKGEGGR